MSDIDNLKSIKTNILATLVGLTASPKPTYSVDGQTISWTEYQNMLFGQLKQINQMIGADEPYELHSEGYT